MYFNSSPLRISSADPEGDLQGRREQFVARSAAPPRAQRQENDQPRTAAGSTSAGVRTRWTRRVARGRVSSESRLKVRDALPVVGSNGRLVRNERGVGVVVEVGGPLRMPASWPSASISSKSLRTTERLRVLDPVGRLAQHEPQQLRVLVVVCLPAKSAACMRWSMSRSSHLPLLAMPSTRRCTSPRRVANRVFGDGQHAGDEVGPDVLGHEQDAAVAVHFGLGHERLAGDDRVDGADEQRRRHVGRRHFDERTSLMLMPRSLQGLEDDQPLVGEAVRHGDLLAAQVFDAVRSSSPCGPSSSCRRGGPGRRS